MRRIAFPLVAALTALSLVGPADAVAPPHEPWGTLCGITATTDPVLDGWRTGEMHAGPLFVGGGVAAEVVCTVQVHVNDTHAKWDSGVVSGSGTIAVVVAGTLNYEAGPGEDAYLCTEVRYPAWGSLYFDEVNGVWTTSPEARCQLLSLTEVWSSEYLVRRPRAVAPPDGALDPEPPPQQPVACSDGVDNDGDGRTDYPSDPDCTDGLDTSESATSPGGCPTTAGVTYCASLTPTTEYQRFAVGGTSSGAVRGHVDAYEFTLPNGAVVTVPCVVLNATSAGADACALAGGRFVSRTMTLVDTGTGGSPLASIRVCNADLVLTANSFGLTRFPAYALC